MAQQASIITGGKNKGTINRTRRTFLFGSLLGMLLLASPGIQLAYYEDSRIFLLLEVDTSSLRSPEEQVGTRVQPREEEV